MSNITLRLVKGSPLTNQEVDNNFANLNTDKYEAGDSASFQDVTLDNMSGPISWNVDDGTLDVPLNASVTLQMGQEFVFYAKATEAISNGDVVMFAGAQGGHLLISKCDMGAVGFDPTHVVGIATQAFATNDFGYVTSMGKVRGINTSSLTEGDVLYVDPTTAGGYTSTKPSSPNHIIQIAAVVRSHGTQGTLLVRTTHMPDTDEVPEGSTNLYFTGARATTAIKADADWNASDWDTAYGWGNHASAGYLTSHQDISGKANKAGDTFTGRVYIDSSTNDKFVLRGSNSPSVEFQNDADAFRGRVGVSELNKEIRLVGQDPENVQGIHILGLGQNGLRYSPNNGSTQYNVWHSGDFSSTKISNWDTAYGWGNHASAGYLTSHQDISGKANLSGDTFTGPVTFTEQGSTFKIDPHAVGVDLYSSGNLAPHYQTTFTLYTGNIGSGTQRLSVDSSGNLSVTGTLSASGYNKSNWDTAYNWGNHASAGYLTGLPSHNHDDRYYTESEADTRFANITGDTFTGNLQVNGGYLEAYGQFYLRDDLNFINAGVNGWHKIIEKNGGNPYFNAIDSYRVGGTTVIDSARNASFVNGSFVGNLDVITGGSSGQIRVGRTSDQNLLINVNDRVALLEHRQDEGTGEHIMQFNINSPTDLANKSFDFTNGNIKVGGTTVIDSSRNLTNIQSLSLSGSDGAIKQSTDTNKNLIIGSANTALRFINNSGQRRIIPRDLDDTAENGTIDLGDSGSKFRDIYLSTGVVIGSTRVIDSSRNLTNIGNITATGQLNLNRGADDALFIDTTVADNTTRPAIKLYENDSQASGRQSIQWFNGNLNYIKAEMWTQVGASFNATRFGIDVADNSRSVSTRLYIENGNTYITGVLNTGTISSTGNHTMSGDSYTLYGGNSTWGAYLQVGGNSRQYVNDSNVASVVTSNGNLHLDASSGRDLYLNFYDGSNVYFGSGANGTVGIVDNAGKATFSSYTIGGTTVIDSARNLTNMGAGSFSSYVSMNELRANSYMLQDGVKEIALGTFNFGNSDPNNFIDIIFTAGSFWGTVEVEITSSYSYQNACGSLIKRFAVGHNTSSTSYGGGSEELISDTGQLSNSIRIGSITRKGTTFVVPVNKFTSTNNNFEVRVKLFSIGYSDSTTVTLGSKYSGTNLAREYVPFRHITGQASNTVISSTIDSTGRLRVSGGNNSDGNAQTSTGAVIGTYVDQYAFIDLASSHANGSWIDFSYADGGDYKGRIRYVNSTGIFEFHANGSSSANMSLGTSYMEMYGGIRADEYRINSTTVIDSSRNITGSSITGSSLTVSGSGQYVAGSIYSDANWGMLFRAKQASPANAQYRWATSTDSELMRIDNNGILKTSGDIQINSGWGGTYPEQLTIEGSYPSLCLRSTSHDFKYLIHTGGTNLQFYTGSGYSNNSWTRKLELDSSGNLDLVEGGYQINNTTVIDSSRNISNVPTATLTSANPLQFTGAGSNTYTLGAMYCDSSGLSIEAPLETNDSSGAHRPITLSWRGGYSAQGGLQIREGVTEVSRQLKVKTDGENGYVQGAVRIETIANYRGAGVFLDNTAANEVWYAGTPYTTHNGYYMIGYASGLGTDAQAQLSYYKLRVDNAGNVSAKNSLQINGTTVIDSNRDLIIGTIGSTATNNILKVKSTGDSQVIGLKASYLDSSTLAGYFRYSTGDAQLYIDNAYPSNGGEAYSNINFRNGSSLTTKMQIKGNTGRVNVVYGLELNGTTVLDANRSLTSIASLDITSATGNITFANSGTTKRGIYGTMGDNDQWFIGGGATSSNVGYLEISTGDDGQNTSGGCEEILVRQYGPGSPLTGALHRTLKLLDNYGNTSIPANVTMANGNLDINTSVQNAIEIFESSGSSGYNYMRFLNTTGSTQYGSIYRSFSSMVYGTSSDYRLKENVVDLTNASDRINLIPVRRFNFIEHPDRTVDGFLAHEVQAIVPEAIIGEKDEVDDTGAPVYQGIDQSKLVPLLTAALQEALQEIKNLKTRVSALEN